MQMNYTFKIVAARNSYLVSIQDERYNQDTWSFPTWTEAVDFIDANENYKIEDEEQVRSSDGKAAEESEG